MTVKFLKDGRIEVKDPHDARLLQMAGVYLTESDGSRPRAFAWDAGDNVPVYVPANVARGLVVLDDDLLGGIRWGEDAHIISCSHNGLNEAKWRCVKFIYIRRHNDRWNLLPDIEMEK